MRPGENRSFLLLFFHRLLGSQRSVYTYLYNTTYILVPAPEESMASDMFFHKSASDSGRAGARRERVVLCLQHIALQSIALEANNLKRPHARKGRTAAFRSSTSVQQPLPVIGTSLQQAITAVLVTVVDPNARLLLLLLLDVVAPACF